MHKLKNPSTIYLIIISLIGISTFTALHQVYFDASAKTVVLYALIGAIVLVNKYPIPLPPDGNSISMDSAIFLGALFLYGLGDTLDVLFIYTLIFAGIQWKIKWWKHVFNFSIYSIMTIAAHFAFLFFGGEVGDINSSNIIPYIASLTVYFILNTTLVSTYFFLAQKESLLNVFGGFLRDRTFQASYFIIFLLSLVLAILMQHEHIFGLFLFVSIALLLSVAFNQHFQDLQVVSQKAKHDYLTGLYNHGYFKEQLEKEVALLQEHFKPLSVALIDLDDFKKYNDLFGHVQGDRLLKEFGTLLHQHSKKQEFLVARYGGEEFAVLMPNKTKEEAFAFLDKVRKTINDTALNGVEILPYGCLSFSAGIAEFEKGTYNIAELLNKADQALYFSKAQGKNMVHIYDKTDQQLDSSYSFEKQFEEAEQQLKIFLSKDIYTYRHSKRVFQYSVDFARKIELSDHERRIFTLGALVHDIGKLEIPRDVINKKGKLDPHEWEMVKKHVIWGKEIISTNKELQELIPLVELHHERFDGKGYPHGLKGESIPKLARMLCIIDSFDAMTTERPYQKTKSFAEAIEEIRSCAGEQFDAYYAEQFIQMIEQQYDINRKVEEEIVV
ncbi:diguanylate cyclase [Mesobacillus subterraneus]|uniref:bifunctional diguanylate cyclase/phosphohydrolase n=1 Tax=Mesobacillus subterraneus TaxID=285983 RepID=UPI00203CD6A9|nr:diguanylate cyclase [Mesobacillus subterraneus]MCM3574165.1 diguanylate cyclase [Mesobacillus subterraneus]